MHRDDDFLTGCSAMHEQAQAGLGISEVGNHVVIVVTLILVGQGRWFLAAVVVNRSRSPSNDGPVAAVSDLSWG